MLGFLRQPNLPVRRTPHLMDGTANARPLALPGLRLDHCDRWVALHFARPRPVLSSAVVNGGLGCADRWLNLKVSGDLDDNRTPPATTVSALCTSQQWHGDTVAMMTAASMNSLRIRHAFIDGQLVLVAVTTGLSNARRAGDPAEYRHLSDPVTMTGTINLAVIADLQLPPAVMVEALMTVTEAKTAALHQRNLRSPVSGELATGTGTDAVAIFASNIGPRADFAGKHTILGEVLGRLALAAIGDSIDMT